MTVRHSLTGFEQEIQSLNNNKIQSWYLVGKISHPFLNFFKEKNQSYRQEYKLQADWKDPRVSGNFLIRLEKFTK